GLSSFFPNVTITEGKHPLSLVIRAKKRPLLHQFPSRVSKEVRSKFPQIPWEAIIGMRNILAHGYDSIDPVKLWHAATVSVPELLKHLDSAIAQMPPFDA
ncbi:MAG: DUF86 domain-containing protein, partial [Verrucomicrobia bacterium]|nr:DUF86 domain-containing protein [Verrucomicrobiota bacterium]